MSRARMLAAIALAATFVLPGTSQAYNMMRSTNSNWVDSNVSRVLCANRQGFMHWDNHYIDWYLNTAGQGAGKQGAIQAALNTWNVATDSDYFLRYAGTWSGGYKVNDGRNTISWGTSSVCDAASCHAITGLLLQAPTTTPNGQVILESDILFNANPNRNFQWMTNGQYSPSCWLTKDSYGLMIDTQGIATHELGHSLGIGHPDNVQDTSSSGPTMGNVACTTEGRTLATDDMNALLCSVNRYPDTPVYDGAIEKLTCGSVSGWALNRNRPYQPSYVEIVEVLSTGSVRLIDAVAANRPRAIGDRHGFLQTLSDSQLFNGNWHTLRVRHTGTAEEVGSKDIICGLELFPQSMDPADPYLSTNGLPYEVATQFESSQPGFITDLGYYFAPTEGDAGPHTIRLWSDSNPNTPLASVSINPPVILGKIGWSYAKLPSKIAIQPGAKYRVSINTYANQSKSSCGSANSLAPAYVNSPLTALQGFWSPGSGVFPTNSSCSNFFVSVRFEM